MHGFSTCFLALYLAHLVTDFLLQTARVVTGKRRGAPGAYAEHGAIHLLAAIAFLGFAVPQLWKSPGFYAFTLGLTAVHLAMDWGKIRLLHSARITDGAATFLWDQFLHFLTVGLAAWLIARPSLLSVTTKVQGLQLEIEKPLLLLVVYLAVIFGGGYVVRFLTRPLLKNDMRDLGETTGELQNAGMYIGWLERFVVLTALMLQSPATVGLILTAKSIVRYPEMKSVRFAEYFLIGTLLSMTIGMLGGLLLLKAFYGSVTLAR
jgi:hypothetical protein